MLGPLSPIGGDRKDLSGVGLGKNDAFVTVSDPRVQALPAPAEVWALPPGAAAVASLQTVADAAGDAVSTLSALGGGVSQLSAPTTPLPPVGGKRPLAGTDDTVADFGSITVDGVTTVLGSVQAPYLTSREAATFVASVINANRKATVQASVNQEGRLQLASKDGSGIEIQAVGGSTTGITAQQTPSGFQVGSYGSSVVAAGPIGGPHFAPERARPAATRPAGPGASVTGPGGKPVIATVASEPGAVTFSPADQARQAASEAPRKLVMAAEEPPVRTATTQTGVELAPAPASARQAAKTLRGEEAGLVGDVAAARAAQQGGVSAGEHIARLTTWAVLEALSPPPRSGADPEGSGAPDDADAPGNALATDGARERGPDAPASGTGMASGVAGAPPVVRAAGGPSVGQQTDRTAGSGPGGAAVGGVSPV